MLTAAVSVQSLIDAISFGALFALMALGLALLFGVMRLMNFAYGELIMVGGYVMYYTQDLGFIPMILITIAAVVLLSILMELIAFRPVRNAPPLTLLITSFAVSFGLQQVAFMTVSKGSQKGVEPYGWLTNQHDIIGLRFSNLDLITILVVVACMVGMTLLLRRTSIGVHLRASTEDYGMAQLVGVRGNRVISAAFAITGLIGAFVCILYVLRTGTLSATMGVTPLLIAFVGGAIGGLGSMVGAALGGFTLGFIINGLQSSLPVDLGQYTMIFAFLAVIAILVVAPNGLLEPLQKLRNRLRGGTQAPSVEQSQPHGEVA
jgi:branched-chain amino acid transport system permease protein